MNREETVQLVLAKINDIFSSREVMELLRNYDDSQRRETVATLEDIKYSLSNALAFNHTLMTEFMDELQIFNDGHSPHNETLLNSLNRKATRFSKSIHKSDETKTFFFKAQKNNIESNFNVYYNNSSSRSTTEEFPLSSGELNHFKMIIDINGRSMEMFPDDKMKITRRIEPETVKYFLNVQNRDICEIEANTQRQSYLVHFEPIGDDFVQPQDYIYDAELDDDIIMKFEMKSTDARDKSLEYHRIPMRELKEHLASVISKETFRLKSPFFNAQTGLLNDEIKIISTQFETNDDVHYFSSTGALRNGQEVKFTNIVPERIKTFIWLETELPPLVGGVQEALKANLTETGNEQSKLLETYLKVSSDITKEGKTYAPFTSFIQSSGFGKSKMCLDLLKKHPGIYMVFRKADQTGLPSMLPWMKTIAGFVGDAKKDEMPIDLDANVDEYTTGRFLYALLAVITAYKNLFDNLCVSHEESADPSKKANVYKETVSKIGSMFQDKFTEDSPINFVLSLQIETNYKFSALLSKIKDDINSFLTNYVNVTTTEKFPFLIFIDEVDVFNDIFPASFVGKSNAVHTIRRGLHLLDFTTPIMVMVIGTNSDAIDFSPAVRDNSLRDIKRKNLLSPFILSGNWDIFSRQNDVDYTQLKFTRDVLCDKAMFNILASFGRALWSSCLLNLVIPTAMAKLTNGGPDSLGSRLALLLSRANFTVNVHHVLARNLIKSYMVIVSYVSSDATEMKIGYSSEPVLAMAARQILRSENVRRSCFMAVKEFLENKLSTRAELLKPSSNI